MSKVQRDATFFMLIIIATFILTYLMFSATWIGSIGGLIVGGTLAGMTLLGGLLSYGIQYYRNQTAFNQKQKSENDMDTYQTRTVEIDVPFANAFDTVLEALNTLHNTPMKNTFTGIPSNQMLKIHKSDVSMGRIEVGVRAKTFGIQDLTDFSRIMIQLQHIDEQTTRIQIESNPTNPLESFDFARHMHYVNHLALTIRQTSQAQVAENNLSADDNEDETNGSIDADTGSTSQNAKE